MRGMKVRVGNVVFEDFNANELDTVINKLRQVGLLGSGSEMIEEAPAPRPVQRPMPAPRPVPVPVAAPAPVPAPKPAAVPAPRLVPQTTLPQAPVPPRSVESEEEDESKSSGWL